jgi:Kef-type K+ transport system membrane component KefB
MRTLRLGGAALIAMIALVAAGWCALDVFQPQATLASQVPTSDGVAALAPSAEPGGDALAGQGASGDAATHDGAEGNNAHGEAAGGHQSPVVPILALLFVIILAARLGGAALERLGQPSVLGELLVGVLLGNLALIGFKGLEQLFAVPVFGNVPAERIIEILGEIGVILLLFEVGLESNIKDMLRVGPSSLLVALLGVIAPFLLGWGVGRLLLPEASVYVHIFLGAILTATSVGITARVLKDLGKLSLRESRIILGAAVIDDVIGLVILAVVSGIIVAAATGGAAPSVAGIGWIIGKALLFLAAAIVIGQWLSPRLFRLAGKLRGDHLVLSTSLAFLFALSFLAGKIGLAPIVGAFAAGLVLDELHYTELKQREQRSLEDSLRPLAGFLVPIFFVYMGYRVDLALFAQPQILGLAGVLTAAAIIGKQLCSLGVLERGLDRLSVGFGMIPRGEVGLIFASIGMSLVVAGRQIVDEGTYGAVVIMVIVTTLMTPPLLKWSLSRNRGYEGASDDEMRRIANERRERRKEYYRQRAREEDGHEGGHEPGRREGGRSGRGERRGRGERGGERSERGSRGGRAGGRGRSGAPTGGAAPAGGGNPTRNEAAAAERKPRDSQAAAEGGERRRRPRRRRRGGGGGGGDGEGGAHGAGGGSAGPAARGTEREGSSARSENRSLRYADST